MVTRSPITICVAPNGARKTTADLPQLPISPEALAAEALRCANAGASLFHIHVREPNQRHSLDPNTYRGAITAIREAVGHRLVLQVTTETVGIYTAPDMIATVRELIPESASIGIKELVPDPLHEGAAQDFLAWAHQQGILIQYICYSADEVRYFNELRQKGVIPSLNHYFLLYVLGKKTGQKGHPSELTPFLEAHSTHLNDVTLHWTVCAFGEDELDCMLEAVRNGGNVRIGFENNHMLANGTIAPHNASLIQQFTNAVKLNKIERPIATVSDLRAAVPTPILVH